MQTIIDQIARQHLGIETLETRNSDSLDFHDCGVAGIKAALEAAYRAGQAAPRHTGPVEISTSEYEFSHGHKPRGRGSWAFEIAGEVTWIPGSRTYGEAKREAVSIARQRGVGRIKACT